MNRTSIEWTDFTINPIIARPEYGAHREDVEILLNTEGLEKLAKRKKPANVFMCSMTDMLGDWVPDEFIATIWEHMERMPQHTFQILTKRHKRMAEVTLSGLVRRLPNVWLGVSVEDQSSADARHVDFMRVVAAVRFVSYEPAIGPIDWSGWECVQLIISGGENGQGARPSHPDWHRETRDFCQRYGIAYTFKQWGTWCYPDQMPEDTHRRWDASGGGGDEYSEPCRTGKKLAGRSLDGRVWNELPGP